MIPFFQGAAGGAAPVASQVFAATTYVGNGSARTIVSGVNLTAGGLLWFKWRSGVYGTINHRLYNASSRAYIESNKTDGETSASSDNVSAIDATGFSLGTDIVQNGNTANYVAWSFVRSARFFDVVTYTGTGSAQSIAHGLGAPPGLILVKRRDTTGAWAAYHRSNTGAPETDVLFLNTTAATTDDDTYWNDTAPTSSAFTVGTSAAVNSNTATYIAYLFAHDAASDGIVQCGSYTGNGSATGPSVSLGWNPQWVMIKRAVGGTGDWVIFDTARGIVAGNDPTLCANSDAAENGVLSAADYIDLTGTGFQIANTTATLNSTGDTYVYAAIRSA